MLPRTASPPIMELSVRRSWPGLDDLAPIARFQTIRTQSMSVSCGSQFPRISMSVASNSETSFSSPLMAEALRGEVSDSISKSEASRFGKRMVRTESRDESAMEATDVLVGGGVGRGSDGGGGENWFGDGFGDSSGPGSGRMEEYYQKMIEAYPSDALILSNYARFLKEVKGDLAKAEEYCERAILAKPNEESALSLYGDLIWQNHRDGARAQSYFDQAVHSAPHDCYVLGSYAKFLWDAGDEDEDEYEDEIEY